MNLSFAQIERVWINAGGSRALAPVMAAIALAESGGNTDAHNANAATGDDSYGLWQINYYGALGASRSAQYGPPSAIIDPANNARAAVALAGGGSGLGNWTTYTSGAYRRFMNGSAIPASLSTSTANASPGTRDFTVSDTSFWSGLKDQLHFDTGILGDILPGTSGAATPTPRQEGKALLAVPRDMYKGVAQIASYTRDALALFAALFRPSLWLRIGAGVAGVLAFGLGLYFIVSGTTGVNATDLAIMGAK